MSRDKCSVYVLKESQKAQANGTVVSEPDLGLGRCTTCERTPFPTEYKAGRAHGSAWMVSRADNLLPLPGLKLRCLRHPARSVVTI
jgi:hypothetical protein